MKKILFSFIALMLFSFVSQAQTWGNVIGQVVDSNQNPVPGVAVFSYGSLNSFINNGQDPSKFMYSSYTSGNGNFWSYYQNVNVGDSVVVGALDCNMNLSWGKAYVASANDTLIINLQIACVPGACDAVIRVDSNYWSPASPPAWIYTAVALRDSNFANISTPVTKTWSYNGITRTSTNSWQGPNEDSILVFSQTNPGPVCFQRMASCTPVCVGGSTPPPPAGHSCTADFYVDSVNSINFNGQIVVWENSSADTGATIIGYSWDFGDGTPAVYQQYPTHTYNDTGVYQVCLTIVSVKQTAAGLDTCTSTRCDSIGLDSNGNLVYKSSGQGFTINVIDPATVGQKEIGLKSRLKLYPNPSTGEATLSWDESVGVEKVDVLSINGEWVRSIDVSGSSHVQLNSLQSGVYLIRAHTGKETTVLRMIVQ